MKNFISKFTAFAIAAFLMAAVLPATAFASTYTAGAEGTEIFEAAGPSADDALKARVFNGLLDHETSIDVSAYRATDADVTFNAANGSTLTGASALAGTVRAHPLFSTLCTSWSAYSFEYNGSTITKVNITYLSTWTTSLTNAFKTKYAQFEEGAPVSGTEFQKAAYVHDWICSHVSYSMQTVYNPEFAIGAIANGKALCAGYAYAYQFLAQQLGLNCNYVAGTTKVESHAWNKVQVDGQWFLVDCTWDNSLAGTVNFSHTYFMLNDDEFAAAGDGSHSSDTDVTGNDPVNSGYYFANKYWQGVTGVLSADLLAQDPHLTAVKQHTEHTWDAGVVTTQPTCAKEGVKTFTCTECGATKTEPIAKTTNHTWDAGKVTKQATTTSTGIKTYTCTVCGATKTETIAKLPTPDPTPTTTLPAATVTYKAHAANIGWMKNVTNGATAGTTGQSRQLEAIQGSVKAGSIQGNLLINAHCQDYGWMGYKDYTGGTTGKSKRLEAVQIKLPTSLSSNYDVYYRVHAANIGWMAWAKNGESAGTQGYGYAIEAIQVKVLKKTDSAPSSSGSVTAQKFRKPAMAVSYQAHSQDVGWMSWQSNGAVAGTTGRGLRLEKLNIDIDYADYSGDIQVKAHVAGIGWQSWGSSGGTTGQGRAIEAVQIKLTGELAQKYNVQYRAHAANIGWMSWVSNGATAGTTGQSRQLEAIQIKLAAK